MRDGWNERALGEVCAFLKRGVSPSYLEHGGICVLNQKCIRGHRVSFELSRRHDVEGKPVSPQRYVRVGDVLVNSTGVGTLGRVAQLRANPAESTTVDSHVTIVRPIDGLFVPEFFGYMLLSIEEQIKEGGEGCGGQTELARSALAEKFRVNYPRDKTSQRRIVGLLDEAYANVSTARTNAKKNLQNARALFESHLQAVFAQGGQGWTEKQLGEIAEFKNGLNFTRRSKGQTLRMVGVGDFRDNAVVPTESLQSVTIDGEIADDYLIRRDDILTVRSNGSKHLVGRCMLVPGVDEVTSYSGFIIRIRFDTRAVNPRFLLRFMKSSETRQRLTSDGGGANISNINQTKLSKLPILLPPARQQEDVVIRLDALAAETQRLESLYQQKLTALAALKKSLLHQAFTGEL